MRSVSPPNSGHEYVSPSSCKAPANSRSQSSPISFGSASDNRKPSGIAPLAARSERLTRKRFARDVAGVFAGKEMHAADQGIGGEHQLAAGRRRDQRRVVGQAEGAGMVASGLK